MLSILLLGIARPGQARPEFPPLLQAALEEQLKVTLCIPQCTACHFTNQGGATMLNKFGTHLETSGLAGEATQEQMNKAVSAYLGTDPDTDGDGVHDIEEIKKGDSPAVAGERGQNEFCPDIRYGCAGGRIAVAPARDDKPAWFAAGLVVVGLSAAMRRRARRARRTG